MSTAGGRRGNLTLANVLEFGSATDQQPMLGFVIQPSLNFVEVQETFLPTANTCTNTINLTRPTRDVPIPELTKLFDMHNYAFSNTYFGSMWVQRSYFFQCLCSHSLMLIVGLLWELHRVALHTDHTIGTVHVHYLVCFV